VTNLFNLALILTLLAAITGLIWLVDALLFAKKRRLMQAEGEEVAEPVVVEYARSLFPIIFAVLLLRSFLAEPFRIPSVSMMPTLLVGDFILVNKFAYGLRLPVLNTKIVEVGSPQRGDVVVFRYPLDVSQFYVKRLIGLPGDVVHFEDGKVRVGDAPFEVALLGEGVGAEVAAEDRGQWLLRETLDGDSHTIKLNPFVQGRLPLPGIASQCTIIRPGAWSCRVPEGHYLMLGDNRDSSADSRDFGFLPHGQVYGKAVRVLFNLSDRSRWWKPL
jgi:signal peptidase I